MSAAWVVESPGPIADHPLRRVERDDPEPGPSQVRVRISCCGVCRTDLHLAEGDLPPHRRQTTPGHEIVGTVDAVGSAATRFHVGEGFAYALPAALPDEQAAPLLCAGLIGYRALRLAEVPPGGALGIYGFGGSAHLIAQVALASGLRVHVLTRGEANRELARGLGVDSVGAATDPPPEPLDGAVLFAPAGELVPVALAALDRGATLAVAGIWLSDIPRIQYERELFQERRLRSVTANTRQDGEEFLRRALRLGVRATTRQYPMTRANDALRDLAHGRFSGAAVCQRCD